MVRMGFGFEQMGNEFLGRGSIFGSPSGHPRWRPFEIGVMGFGKMFVQGGKLSLLITSGMGGDTSILEEDFDGT